MYAIEVFTPIGAGGEIDVTSTAATTTLRVAPAENTAQIIRLVNHGGVKARVRFARQTSPGVWTQDTVTDATGFVLMPGMTEVFDLSGAPSMSVKTESGATDVNYQLGAGS